MKKLVKIMEQDKLINRTPDKACQDLVPYYQVL